jgi:hypothetical protein
MSVGLLLFLCLQVFTSVIYSGRRSSVKDLIYRVGGFSQYVMLSFILFYSDSSQCQDIFSAACSSPPSGVTAEVTTEVS